MYHMDADDHNVRKEMYHMDADDHNVHKEIDSRCEQDRRNYSCVTAKVQCSPNCRLANIYDDDDDDDDDDVKATVVTTTTMA